MSFTAIVWVWNESEKTGGFPAINIERCLQINGTTLYAVRQAGACLSRSGEWEYEPIPSSRDDEFMARCRFESWGAAAHAITRFCEPAGRFIEQYRANRG